MTKLAELSVTSHHPNMRITASQTFLTFLLQYPLGEKRLQFHLKQVMDYPSIERLSTTEFKRPPRALVQYMTVFMPSCAILFVMCHGNRCLLVLPSWRRSC